MKSLFFGGIHPADRKELSASAQLQPVNQPKQVTIPMLQHIGNPCNPLVKVGDYVKKDRKLVMEKDYVYQYIHPFPEQLQRLN